MISNKKLIHIDKILKKNLKQAINKKIMTSLLRLIELSAHLKYNYAFDDTLYDEELENSLKQISNSLFKSEKIVPNEDVVLFYDYFGYDNRGLT